MDFLNMLTDMFKGSDSTQVLSENTGISADSIGKVINTALPAIVQAMTDNASSSEGAQSLYNALGQHQTEKSLTEQLQNADTEDGNKILGHIFGNSVSSEYDSIAQDTGLSSGQIGNILSSVAPSILSSLSSAVSNMGSGQENPGSGASGLLGLLSAFNN